jgi:hypothetical protein
VFCSTTLHLHNKSAPGFNFDDLQAKVELLMTTRCIKPTPSMHLGDGHVAAASYITRAEWREDGIGSTNRMVVFNGAPTASKRGGPITQKLFGEAKCFTFLIKVNEKITLKWKLQPHARAFAKTFAAAKDQEESRARAEKEREQATAAATEDAARGKKLPCRDHKVGKCTRGDKCKFSHAMPAAKPAQKPVRETNDGWTDVQPRSKRKADTGEEGQQRIAALAFQAANLTGDTNMMTPPPRGEEGDGEGESRQHQRRREGDGPVTAEKKELARELAKQERDFTLLVAQARRKLQYNTVLSSREAEAMKQASARENA